jgi:hypothetical protein
MKSHEDPFGSARHHKDAGQKDAGQKDAGLAISVWIFGSNWRPVHPGQTLADALRNLRLHGPIGAPPMK